MFLYSQESMKIYITFLILLFFNSASAQDLIILQSGEEVEAKVIEVGTEEIKYYKTANLNGPIYALKRSEVFLIKYESGHKEIFKDNSESIPLKNKPVEEKDSVSDLLSYKSTFFGLRYYQGNRKISKSTFISILKTDPDAYEHYSTYSINKGLGRFFRGVSMLGTIYAVVFIINSDNTNALIAAISGMVSGMISRLFNGRANDKLELAVAIFNKNLNAYSP